MPTSFLFPGFSINIRFFTLQKFKCETSLHPKKTFTLPLFIATAKSKREKFDAKSWSQDTRWALFSMAFVIRVLELAFLSILSKIRCTHCSRSFVRYKFIILKMSDFSLSKNILKNGDRRKRSFHHLLSFR